MNEHHSQLVAKYRSLLEGLRVLQPDAVIRICKDKAALHKKGEYDWDATQSDEDFLKKLEGDPSIKLGIVPASVGLFGIDGDRDRRDESNKNWMIEAKAKLDNLFVDYAEGVDVQSSRHPKFHRYLPADPKLKVGNRLWLFGETRSAGGYLVIHGIEQLEQIVTLVTTRPDKKPVDQEIVDKLHATNPSNDKDWQPKRKLERGWKPSSSPTANWVEKLDFTEGTRHNTFLHAYAWVWAKNRLEIDGERLYQRALDSGLPRDEIDRIITWVERKVGLDDAGNDPNDTQQSTDNNDVSNEDDVFSLVRWGEIPRLVSVDTSNWVNQQFCLQLQRTTMLFGEEKKGKSYVTRQMIFSSLLGKQFLENETNHMAVVWFAEESLSDLYDHMMEEAPSLIDDDRLYAVAMDQLPEVNFDQFKSLIAHYHKQLAQAHPDLPQLFIYDTLDKVSELLQAGSEDKTDQGGVVVKTIKTLGRNLGIANLIIHQRVKDPMRSTYRGSSAFGATVDAKIGFTRRDDGVITFDSRGRRLPLGNGKRSYKPVDGEYRVTDNPVEVRGNPNRNRAGQYSSREEQKAKESPDPSYIELREGLLDDSVTAVQRKLEAAWLNQQARTLPLSVVCNQAGSSVGLRAKDCMERLPDKLREIASSGRDKSNIKVFYILKDGRGEQIGLNNPPIVQ